MWIWTRLIWHAGLVWGSDQFWKMTYLPLKDVAYFTSVVKLTQNYHPTTFTQVEPKISVKKNTFKQNYFQLMFAFDDDLISKVIMKSLILDSKSNYSFCHSSLVVSATPLSWHLLRWRHFFMSASMTHWFTIEFGQSTRCNTKLFSFFVLTNNILKMCIFGLWKQERGPQRIPSTVRGILCQMIFKNYQCSSKYYDT